MNIRKEPTADGYRFVVDINGQEAELTLKKIRENVFSANHTRVPNAARGKGIAGKLYDAMVKDAQSLEYKIMPHCSYIAAKFKRHRDIAAEIGA